ncbi:uroporphyrinogen-III synthase [Porphyromonas sp.]|uniref:uroporphyrinogen-III synthase n=1 Tax=Porphyromonas sp. TaxID=1924944 RepID=UPI0026DAEF9C|nr:uroporphyrinogen-III synthase [Porphyromonas sp.]MDO4695325.1 uroporphyrinogen-III synthase [Porphyromonas sp.]MDO4771085.1 uroporphyrinogen-III synthase [Porphyromonas sp.]
MRKFGIIGREPKLVNDIVKQVKDVYPELDLLCLPPIRTCQNEDVRLPQIAKDRSCIIFSSPRGAQHYIDSFGLPKGRVVTIGQATELFLSSKGVEVCFRPSVETSQGLVDEFYPILEEYDRNFGIQTVIVQPTSNIAGIYMRNFFSSKGYEYYLIPLYETTPHPEFVQKLQEVPKCPDFFVFCSPSGVQAWSEALEKVSWSLDEDFVAVSIGPKTSQALIDLGYKNIREASTPHSEDIAKEIIFYLKDQE